MIDFIFEYLEAHGVSCTTEIALAGIRLFLFENGLPAEEPVEHRDYYKKHLHRLLKRIDDPDLWMYFLEYENISKINQLCIEYREDGYLTAEKVTELRDCMCCLYKAQLGNKYIPAIEVAEVL